MKEMLNTSKLIAVLALGTMFAAAVPSVASAQARGRAVPRRSARVVRPQIVTVVPYRPTFYRYRPGFNVGIYSGYSYWGPNMYRYTPPYGYAPYGYNGYGYSAVPYGYAPSGYGAYGYRGRPYGGVRIDLPQRDAEVWADGYFMGTVDEFDGVLQQANLEAGPHRIEIRAPGFEPIEFDVNVEPGRTITYRASMQPDRP